MVTVQSCFGKKIEHVNFGEGGNLGGLINPLRVFTWCN